MFYWSPWGAWGLEQCLNHPSPSMALQYTFVLICNKPVCLGFTLHLAWECTFGNTSFPNILSVFQPGVQGLPTLRVLQTQGQLPWVCGDKCRGAMAGQCASCLEPFPSALVECLFLLTSRACPTPTLMQLTWSNLIPVNITHLPAQNLDRIQNEWFRCGDVLYSRQ